ncbi:zf-TFIIB domain-containing protein [Flavihumibacter solisilvae]|uniref:Transcription factor zinc-finger domain-containing protein n=1 Tax=Flavihumibacter solisilvae TaxID=1349421 RepID=A0A0C1J0F5_9BACT|nr:zf-TFIIB domain-containing protein [Flavihumibacter solisilvae]KIC96249.1 hypothetical protein OI18_00310 [Flavihumibacter solisilvae]
MKCPNCDETLVMTERQGIEIDYCPKCRGVWLDKGELDKIIERSFVDQSSQQQLQKPNRYDDTDLNDDFFGRHKREHSNKPYKKRGGFLGDLFDFD